MESSARPRILIVEDDARITRALSIRLEAAGYDVVAAQDGSTGLTAAVREQPDLMLLDISMPAGGGFFIAERAPRRADLAEIPIVFITASKAPELRRRARELGAVGFIEKPYRSKNVLSMIDDALSCSGAAVHTSGMLWQPS